VMCTTNDDVTSNGASIMMWLKKKLENGKGNDEKVVTIEEKKWKKKLK
jgi:hypothetical protein